MIGLAALAIVAVHVAGIWGIALARRGVLEESDRVFRLETAARARWVESTLASSRADLAFLAGGPALLGIESELGSADPMTARWRRLSVEGALLLFLRGHMEVSRVVVRSGDGGTLVAATRRGGVPVLWTATPADRGPSGRAGGEGGSSDPLTGRFEIPPETRGPRSGPPPAVEATIEAGALLLRGRTADDHLSACVLLDATGRTLAGAPETASSTARAAVHVSGWSARSPWSLVCTPRRDGALALVEPLTTRYSLTLFLNLAVMALGVLLGAFAIVQVRRAHVLEAGAREEARVRELERQLFHSERLGTVGRLAAGLAHEINNPLEGMSNYLRLAREDLARRDPDSAARRIEGAEEGLRRAAGIVRQVLAHADAASVPEASLDLGEVLAGAVEFVRSRREFVAIRFRIDQETAPLIVRGSSVMLGQVFLNLLLNACEAQPQGGEVLARTWREGDDARVEIADRGPGVPREELDRLFEPFYSTKNSTGLGLSICDSIVRRHGGEITVQGRRGGGASFTVRIRVAPSPPSAHGAAGSV